MADMEPLLTRYVREPSSFTLDFYLQHHGYDGLRKALALKPEAVIDFEVTANRLGAYAEQKTAAQLEIQNIRNGGESQLSGSEREKRDALHADLTSTDARKRTQALRELRGIYNR